jgi:hypothetical protein
MESTFSGISIGLRQRDQLLDITFGTEHFVIDPQTAAAIVQGIQECLAHIETLKKEPTHPVVHRQIFV